MEPEIGASGDATAIDDPVGHRIDRLEPTGPGGPPQDPYDPVTVPPKIPRWPFVVAGIIVMLGIAIGVAWPINVPYYAMSPGPVNDTADFVTVAEPLGAEQGEMLFLTVSLQEINALEYVGALLDDTVDLSPRENIRPAGVTSEQLRQQNLDAMESSKDSAIYVALTQLGYDVTFDGSGAVVESVIEDSPAEGLLLEDDLITAIDGETVEFSDDAGTLVRDHSPGDTITITVERTSPDDIAETVEVPVTLAPYRFVEEDGTVSEDPDRGMLGVLLLNGPTDIQFPVDVSIDSQNIGGPSAGMMFALEVMNQLTEEDLTHGHRIAGTGTIDPEGTVGAIGGIRQKVYGAIGVGAEYVLVPARNYDDALTASGDDIEVVRIETIDDALAFLETLPPAVS